MKLRLPVVLGLLALVTTGGVCADELSGLKGGAVWNSCETYFNRMRDLRYARSYYKIRDESVSFLKTAKTLRPASRKEAYLLIECVNLANGNAHDADNRLRKEQAADDQFLENLRIDATNNSNASQHRYMSRLDGKHRFDLQGETAKAQFESELNAARRGALAFVLRTFSITLGSIGGSGFNFDVGLGGNANLPFQQTGSFSQVARNATRAHQNSTAPSSGAAEGTFTPAPIGPSGPRAGREPGPSGRVAAAPDTGSPVVRNDNAPHADPNCASYTVSEDGLLATVKNRCDFPIEWRWCWMGNGGELCTPNLLSGIIPVDGETVVEGPDAIRNAKAVSIVCNMSNTGKFCRI